MLTRRVLPVLQQCTRSLTQPLNSHPTHTPDPVASTEGTPLTDSDGNDLPLTILLKHQVAKQGVWPLVGGSPDNQDVDTLLVGVGCPLTCSSAELFWPQNLYI